MPVRKRDAVLAGVLALALTLIMLIPAPSMGVWELPADILTGLMATFWWIVCLLFLREILRGH